MQGEVQVLDGDSGGLEDQQTLNVSNFKDLMIKLYQTQSIIGGQTKLKCSAAPLSFPLPASATNFSQEEKEFIGLCTKEMQNKLFYWSSFAFELPKSQFIACYDPVAEEQPKMDINLFQTPPSSNELDSLAIDETGARRRLSPSQLQQIRETGCFSVSSELFEGKEYQWELTSLLASGNQRHRNIFYSGIAGALSMLEKLPRCFIKTSPISIYSSLVQIPRAIKDFLSLLIGIPEKTLWKPLPILLEQKRLQYIFQEFQDEIKTWRREIQESVSLPPGHGLLATDIDGNLKTLDMRLWNQKIVAEVEQIVYAINFDVFDKWTRERHSFIHKQLQTINIESKEQSDNEIVNLCAAEYNKRFYVALGTAEALDKFPEMRELLYAKIMIHSIISKVQRSVTAEISTLRREIEKNIREIHTIRCYDPAWVSKEVTKRLARELGTEQGKMEEKLLAMNYELCSHQFEVLLRSTDSFMSRELTQKLEEQIYLIKRDMEWKIHQMQNDTKWIQENMLVPSRMFIWSSKIFLHRNQPILRRENGERKFYRETYEKFSVSSASWFWRWRIMFIRTYVWFKNTASYCRHAIFDSPQASLKTLFYQNPFPSYYEIDPKTGIEVSMHLTSTLISRIIDLWRNVKSSRTNFERQPDSGFLGKGVSRVFNIFWNYFIKLGLGLPLLIGTQTLKVFANVAVHLILAVANFVTAPVASLLRFICNVLIYDIDHAGVHGFRILPLFSLLVGRLMFGCVGQLLLCIFAVVGIIPGVAGLQVSLCTAVSVIGYLYDWFMFHLIVKRRGRLPHCDSFSARCVSGPGLHNSYYLQIGASEALALLRLQLEHQELSIYKEKTSALIDLPTNIFQRFIYNVFGVFGLHGGHNEKLTKTTKKFHKLLSRHIQQRHTELPRVDKSYNRIIRLQEEELKQVLAQSIEIVKDFVTQRIFTDLYQSEPQLISNYWKQWDVSEGDWNEITSKQLSGLFSDEFLTPLTDEDCSLRLKINHSARVKNFVKMIKNEDLRDDLQSASVSYSKVSPSVLNRILNKTRFSVDLMTVGFFRYTPFAQPISLDSPQ